MSHSGVALCVGVADGCKRACVVYSGLWRSQKKGGKRTSVSVHLAEYFYPLNDTSLFIHTMHASQNLHTKHTHNIHTKSLSGTLTLALTHNHSMLTPICIF